MRMPRRRHTGWRRQDRRPCFFPGSFKRRHSASKSPLLLCPADAGDVLYATYSFPHDRRLVDETVNKFGRLDILVNNASQQVSYCRRPHMIDATSSRPVHCGSLLMDPWLQMTL